MNYLFLALLICANVFAHENNDITHRPPSFAYSSGKASFVDFEEATYDITYDLTQKSASVVATIKMNVVEEGFPVFDLIAEPSSIKIDNVPVTATLTSTPSGETKVRVINRALRVGTYDVQIKTPLSYLVEYTATGIKSAFWVTDLEDRYYLERYIPVNLEYDRVKMTFNLNFIGVKDKQHIFTNGDVKWLADDKAQIEFPEYFTVNSLYFHTTPVGSVELLESTLKSVNGREIPLQIYQASSASAAAALKEMKNIAQRTFSELERDYGAFHHKSMTIYNASLASMGLGGMEYAGATVTNRSSLPHEFFHSYFARGVTPANGNAGWIDESLASWRDNGYNRLATLNGSSAMAAHPTYTRKTDTDAYSFGARFMAFLDNKFAAKGGLKPFMNKLLDRKLFEPIFAEDFISEMELFYGESLKDTFNTYVFDKAAPKSLEKPAHRKLSGAELYSIL